MTLHRKNMWMKIFLHWAGVPALFVLISASFSLSSGAVGERPMKGEWVAGDFHQHTTYTDGSNSFRTVMYKNNQFGLDWWANSEHGGSFPTDARGPLTVEGPFNVNGGYAWTDTTRYPANVIIDGTTKMWRWQSLRDFSYFDVLQARGTFFKPILQSFEWNVPGHEHCSLGNISGQFDPSVMKADPIAQFEYLFDANDTDVSGGQAQGWTGKNLTNDHAKAVAAVSWLQANYGRTSYAVFAHVERKGVGNPAYVGSGSYGYNISDFRDFNNAAPDVCFGFESMPGHQKQSDRGGYTNIAMGGGTYGGTGLYAAQVGGLWDALLGEGRHWWLFASSDFHNSNEDFWPGEYQKTYTFVADRYDPQAIVDGLRSGNGFVVEGDLINALDFHLNAPHASNAQEENDKNATMGDSLIVSRKGAGTDNLEITIRFRSPQNNNNGDDVSVDHIDLIAGNIMGPVMRGTANYDNPSNPTTRVMATFTPGDWKVEKDGWNVIHYQMKLSGDAYFRLRGTNLHPNTPNQTDAVGNPLSDVRPNSAAEAYKDLWFYSNPIFVYIR